MIAYLLTTHPGLEAIVVEELTAHLGHPPAAINTEAGRVAFKGSEGDLDTLFRLRSIHHILLWRGRYDLRAPVTLEQIESAVAATPIPELQTAASFRVRSVRRGGHDFKHMAIERTAGAVLHHRSRVPVNLDAPAVTVRVDLDDEVLSIGILRTDKPLSRRAKVFAQRIGLSADLAFAAVHVAELAHPERILDPFCGSGTLLLEAGAVFPRCELWGSDWIANAVAGAERNLAAAGYTDRAYVREQDALHMADIYPAKAFDALVTNPPFGVKMSRGVNYYRFYHRLLTQADAVLKPHGRLVLWVHRLGQLQAAVKHQGQFEFDRTIRVQAGAARPCLASLKRRVERQ